MKLKFYLIRTILLLTGTVVFQAIDAQVAGTVFRDMNANGIQDNINPTEPGEYGVTVKAYNAANSLIATATTDAAGFYSFSAAQAAAGTALRLEFSASAGDYPSRRAAADRSNIQFVIAGPTANSIDYALATKKLLSDNSNPFVATTAATNGNALATGAGNAGDNDNLYVFPYDLSGNGGSTRRAKNQYTGSVFGLAWQRESRTLLMAAYLKRHAGFGPGGIGAIYQTQINHNGEPTAPTLLLDVNAMGINVGTDPRVNPLPDASADPNTDQGVFAEVGKRGIGSIELADNGRDLYIVNMYENKLHRINIGNPLKTSFSSADVTGTWAIPDPGIAGTAWHPMALKTHAGKMYVGGICTREVTTAYNVADTANLTGVVYEINIKSASPVFTEVMRFPITHRRGFTNADFRYENRNNYWSAWQNNGDISIGGPLRSDLLGSLLGGNATGIYYSQPLFSSIEFDVDGSMVIALRDRFGDQGGYANYFETGNVPGETYRVLSSGEMMRAGKTNTGWMLEKNATVSSGGITTATPGLADNNPLGLGSFLAFLGSPWGGSYGPGGKYYYYNQNFTNTGVPAAFAGSTNTGHYLKTNGGLALLPGFNEIMTTAIDPMSQSFTNGLLKNYNLGADAGNMAGRMALIASASGDPSNMGKAAALGDLELLLDAQSVEIGNRVWNDINGNGRQDADEPGIANVEVVLRSPGDDGVYNNGDDQTWTVTTDANGNYYFDGSFVNDDRRPASWIGVSNTNSGILPGFEYKVEINPQSSITGLLLTAAHASADEIDNDGTYDITRAQYIINPGGSAAPNSSFENNYNIDFGFSNNSLLSVNKIELTATLVNSDVKLQWNTFDELNVRTYTVERSTDNRQFSSIGFAVSKGNGSFTYQSVDNIEKLGAVKMYYRVKIVDTNGRVKYSATVSVNSKLATGVMVTPNPFISFIQVQARADKNGTGSLRIVNAGGQVIYNRNVQLVKGQNSFTIDGLENTARGMYYFELEAAGTVAREKIMKQ
ncbi:MAG: SdrD B-like domain-containing protein [Chitinophagaceae bacterium]